MKGRLWCAGYPTVTVPNGAEPKVLTYVTPYYENPVFFAEQLRHWHELVKAFPSLLFIVVDDGSPTTPAVDVVKAGPKVPVRVFRIEQDVRWNWLAARNIGAFYAAAGGWLLMTDMDHVVPVETMRAALYGQHHEQVVYGFSRREHEGHSIAPHPNSWLMTRDLFWKIGGYDEALSGHYGTDGEWRRRIVQHAPLQILWDHLVRHERIGDSSTTRYQRKQPQDAGVRKIVASRGPNWIPKTLSFPYHEDAWWVS